MTPPAGPRDLSAEDPHGLLAVGYRQPDQLSCGATAGVVAAALLDPRLAASLRDDPRLFRTQVLLLHRRLTAARGADGRRQVPWPRALGTPPRALARHLSIVTGRPHRVRLLRGPGARATRTRTLTALEAGTVVALYVGNAWLPRHVLLALPPALARPLVPAAPAHLVSPVAVHDPATGRVRREDLGPDGHGPLAHGWPVPWFAVLPADV